MLPTEIKQEIRLMAHHFSQFYKSFEVAPQNLILDRAYIIKIQSDIIMSSIQNNFSRLKNTEGIRIK